MLDFPGGSSSSGSSTFHIGIERTTGEAKDDEHAHALGHNSSGLGELRL